jgi:hypothetical protein
LPQIAIWLPTQLPTICLFAGADQNTDRLPKPTKRVFYIFKSYQKSIPVLTLVYEAVSRKSEGIGIYRTAGFHKDGANQSATERT